ncbi:MAG: DUF2924 domain-containing protein [Deltaproteobacteria bacterium]|nr:DUF2924 domain-containing protein [Deltaproteobacteria bacterium]
MNTTTKKQIAKLNKMKLNELQAKFAEVTGEKSRSPNKTFLIRRITETLQLTNVAAKPNKEKKREVQPSRIRKRGTNGQVTDRQVLPIRMQTSLVQKLDAARERLGLKNRTELFRRSLYEYLCKAGETEVAKLLSDNS